MAVPLFTNNASGTLAGSYNAVATDLTLTAGQGALFPSPTGGDWFALTLVDSFNNIEIVKCTARTGDTLTVVRGQEGTAARALGAGEKAELRVTAAALAGIRDQQIDATRIEDGAVTANKIGVNAVTSTKIAAGAIAFASQIADGIITGAKLQIGAVVAALGFTPVQQGGGAGQTSNKIYLGWSEPNLRVQVDASDLGSILTERQTGVVRTAGYRGLPPNTQNADYVVGLADSGGTVKHTTGTHTYTLPGDATPHGEGTVIQIVNMGGTLNIAPALGVTLTWAPSGGTGARTLTAPGVCTVQKIGANHWWITGAGIG